MPPKPAAKGAPAKGATKAPAKTGAAKGASGTKTGVKTGGGTKDAAKKEDVKKVEEDLGMIFLTHTFCTSIIQSFELIKTFSGAPLNCSLILIKSKFNCHNSVYNIAELYDIFYLRM